MSTGDRRVRKKNVCVVYGLYSNKNSNVIKYIGQTTMPLNKRVALHRYQAKNINANAPVGKWIVSEINKGNKILIKPLVKNAIWNVTEINTIAKYKNILNQTKGGQGHLGLSLSESHKNKISKSLKGRKIPEKQKKYLSKIMTGRKMSLEIRNKIRDANKGRIPINKGQKMTRDERINISKLRGGKPVIVYDKFTNIKIGVWPCISICADELNLNPRSISSVLSGKTKSVGNYTVKRLGV